VSAAAPVLRMLFWTREEFQTFRVDVDVLFGRELIGRGHEIDLVMESPDASIAAGEYPWYGRRKSVASALVPVKLAPAAE